MNRRAFITGISGQDGSHLADFLLEKGYEVHGLVRRPVTERFENLEHCRDRIVLHYGDVTDAARLVQLFSDIQPHETYNLAGLTFVPASWDQPAMTAQVTGVAVATVLDAWRLLPDQRAKFYQASSSEMFGNAPAPQNEDTPMHPLSPYAVAKLYAHRLVRAYRERYGAFCVSGICFNHEGPRRGRQFVTRKIAAAVARIKEGAQDSVTLGNLEARRDWGFAPDYVRAMWMMLQTDQPQDYVIATNQSRSVKEFADAAFLSVGLEAEKYVRVDAVLCRKNEIGHLQGDYERIRSKLGWQPAMNFEDMVSLMVQAEMK